MNLGVFWKKRERIHQKKLFKYLKYVFNDHFVIVLLFFAGAAGYGYSEYVKTIQPDALLPQLLVWLLLFGSLFIGKLATLLQPADIVFLLPLEIKLEEILKRMKWRSFVLPAVILSLLSAAVMPLLLALEVASFSQWLVLAGTLLFLKDVELDYQLISFKIWDEKRKKRYKLALYVSYLASLFLFLFVLPWSGFTSALLVNGIAKYYFKKTQEKKRWQWEKMIDGEKARLQRIYRFINLFTEIPALTDHPKRRKWADGLVNRIPSQKRQPYFYLFLRGFIRGTSYSGLFLRLVVIGIAVIWFSNRIEISILIGIVFLYLIGFQLIPLYYHFDDSLLLRLYPISSNQKMTAMQKMMFLLLGSASIVFWLASIYQLGILISLYLLLIYFLFSSLFVWMYMPNRLKKKNKKEII